MKSFCRMCWFLFLLHPLFRNVAIRSAEMYAFTMAVADVQLKFALSSSYMVSDASTMSTTESWLWIDDYHVVSNAMNQSTGSLRNVCEGASHNSLPTETLRRLENYGYGRYNNHGSNTNSAGALPTTLHYCQRYTFANHTFAKRKIPHDFFRCNGEPMKLDVDKIMEELDSLEQNTEASAFRKKVDSRNAFMLCHLIPLLNMALEEYQADVCS